MGRALSLVDCQWVIAGRECRPAGIARELPNVASLTRLPDRVSDVVVIEADVAIGAVSGGLG
jgi:hypothetical protein